MPERSRSGLERFELTLRELAGELRSGVFTSLELTRAYLERATASSSVYSLVMAERALREAAAADTELRAGRDRGPLHGLPLALKDNLALAGEVTTAGSIALAGGPHAAEDAVIVQRLRAAGTVILGRTVMTELAFTALGINALQGTPKNALDAERVPGGSSSGAAVAVAMKLAPAAVASDTGGSIRIPAAFNGLVGLKPRNGSLPLAGSVPLAPTLDTFGPLARSAADVELVWQALSGQGGVEQVRTAGLRVLVPRTVMLDSLDTPVHAALERAVEQLRELGCSVVERDLPVLAEVRELYTRYGSFAGHEAYRQYADLLRREGSRMDQRLVRDVLAYDSRDPGLYAQLSERRVELQREFERTSSGYDLLLSPTVPVLPPLLSELTSAERVDELESLVLRNTQLLNLLGVPALNLPGSTRQEPVGVTLWAAAGREGLLLMIGRKLERLG